MSYLFVFRTIPDVDHMVPLAWKLLDAGEEVHAVVSPGFDVGGDYRVRFLTTFDNFHLYETRPKKEREGIAATIRGVWRSSLPWAVLTLRRSKARIVAVEWGYGLPDAYSKSLLRPAGVVAVARSLARSVVRAWKRDPVQIRTNFVVAARLLGKRSICLPHGLNVKTEKGALSEKMQQEGLDSGGKLDWSDRAAFDAYVVNTENARRWHVDNTTMPDDFVEARGSLRWAPEWFELNKDLAPDYQWPETEPGAVKLCFMVPKWKNKAHPDRVIELFIRLQQMPNVSLAVKGHPRPTGNADPLRDDPRIDWSRIIDVSKFDSVAVIRASDVVIDIGSSIGVEVVMQDKVLLNPEYLHDLDTLFDEIDGSCMVAHNAEEVVAYLERHAAGDVWKPTEAGYNELLRHCVYAGRDSEFDVIGDYVQRVREIALAGDR